MFGARSCPLQRPPFFSCALFLTAFRHSVFCGCSCGALVWCGVSVRSVCPSVGNSVPGRLMNVGNMP